MRRSASFVFVLSLAVCAPAQKMPMSHVAATRVTAQPSLESFAPGHLVVVYRNGMVPANADELAAFAGARSAIHLRRFGMSALQITGSETEVIARLRLRSEVTAVLHDRYVTAHALQVRSPAEKAPMAEVQAPTGLLQAPAPQLSNDPIPAPLPVPLPVPLPRPRAPIVHFFQSADSLYNSPQGWAVRQAGGYGAKIPGGPATGPWNASLGAGVRIAILDSGVDAHHPDITPNLLLNLSEVEQAAFPSPCDDGSPQDQQGHGTWVASLAAGALGPGTGEVVGVAPQATLLNIKVLERMPAYGAGVTLTANCEAGQAAGLLSWVLEGIEDAIANRANVISLSLGSLVDISTGDGAGWKAQFDSVTYAAGQAGVVIVAALGNDGLDLTPSGPNGRFVELPAQARNVLAVVAATNPACAEDTTPGASCVAGPVTRPYYSSFGAVNAIAAPGGSFPEGPGTATATAISGFIMGACSSGLVNTSDGLPGGSNESFGCFGVGHTAYLQAMGTSAAAPLVAGAAALLHAARPDLSAAQIVSTLQSTAVRSGGMIEPLLDLPAALAAQSSTSARR